MTRSRQNNIHGIRWVGAVIACVLLALAACAGPRTASLTIFHTNDIHAHLERRGDSVGAAEVAGVIALERERNANVLVLDAGDMISGTAVSSLSRGRAPFVVLARMGYDAAVLGNHELDHGWRSVAGYRELAPFPLLCANAFGPDGKLLADALSEIFEFGPLRVGVVGVITGQALEHTTREGNEGVWIHPPEKLLPGLVEKLREDDVHLVVVLSHCGIEADRVLARDIPGIDIIVGGHSHTTLEEPERIGDTWIVQTGSYLRNLGRLRIHYDLHERRVLEVKGELLQPDAPVHPDVAAAVQDTERDIAPGLDRVIGQTPAPVTRRDLQRTVERIYKARLGTDLAYHNPGGVRKALAAGPITVRVIWQALPFENTLVKMSFKGADLPKNWRSRVDGEIDPDRTYVVATNSYVSQHQKRYIGREGVPVEDTKIGAREAVLEAIEAAGGLTPR
jgi:5'-nucleotidase / UDP-sugar diphosphatase